MTDSGNYAERSAALRETAKWIAAVFVATGAALSSGLSFASVGKAANSAVWILPVSLAAVPVLAAAWAVRTAVSIISQGAPGTAQLLPKLAGQPSASATDLPLRTKITGLLPATVATFGSIDQFEDQLVNARRQVSDAESAYDKQRNSGTREAVEDAYKRLGSLQEGVRDLVLCADFIQVKERYKSARWTLLVAAVLGVAAAAASGVLAARDASQATALAGSTATASTIVGPMAVRVYLSMSTSGTPCPLAEDQAATAIGGTFTSPLLLFAATPEAHATAKTPKRCLLPWTWAPPANHVVVVPQTQAVRANG